MKNFAKGFRFTPAEYPQEIEERIQSYKRQGYKLPPRKALRTQEQLEGIRESLGNPSLCGDLSYLGLEGHRSDIPTNLLLAFREDTLEKEVLSAKPVYLKETYLR